MSIQIGEQVIPQIILGVNNLNKIMLGAIEIFPNLPTWSPEELFSGGEQGGYFRLHDISTLFQDTAGTIPLTAIGQTIALAVTSVGGLNIQSGNAAQRAIFDGANGAVYDGVDDLAQSITAVWGSFITVAAKAIMSAGSTTGTSGIGGVIQPSVNFVVAGSRRDVQRAQVQARSAASGQVQQGGANNTFLSGVPQSVIAWSTDNGATVQSQASQSVEGVYPTPPFTGFTNANIRLGSTSASGVTLAQLSIIEMLVINRVLTSTERQQLLDFWA